MLQRCFLIERFLSFCLLLRNDIGEVGVAAIAAALRHTPRLTLLNLAWNAGGIICFNITCLTQVFFKSH